MRKVMLFVFILLVISIVACQQAAKKEAKIVTTTTTTTPAPAVEQTGDAAVDAVGKDLNNTDSVEKDLGTDQLTDLESGLGDVQNI